jgi:large subunit ribosomal protein L19
MSKSAVIQKLEARQIKKNVAKFNIGDTVRVHTRIIEGQKERIQMFTGTVISRRGAGIAETFALHRVAYGEGMERIFFLHSPRIAKIEVMKRGKVRRAKLNYLIGSYGKKSKVKGLFGLEKQTEEQVETENETPNASVEPKADPS